ncbi:MULTISPECIES: GntR family transcriptional regulator [Thermomonosporaceae]|uniref:GntR family transcriptional regulator n=1 Tax=Thermomonosporaceae TaxID=2012 RepID=UPI00255A77E6|nr:MULTISPECIES: GntR family transcriptional regulator [Thermomonosporaceae]MDL4777405.1 GntR family transcriptional regulator [Actinomadura xylanilytica]
MADTSPAHRVRDRPQLSDEAAAYGRELIMSGQVRPGEYVRVERIAADLDISITPAREGLMALRGEGFVELAPRKGFAVSTLRRQDVRDIAFAQGVLAGELAARAARNLAPATLAEIERVQESIERDAGSDRPERIDELNYLFHREIYLAADAPKLTWMIDTATKYTPRRFHAVIPGWNRIAVEDHRVVLAALRTRDPEAARAAMNDHMAHSGTLLVEHLEGRGFWAAQDA